MRQASCSTPIGLVAICPVGGHKYLRLAALAALLPAVLPPSMSRLDARLFKGATPST
jgi:hypothetical protein